MRMFSSVPVVRFLLSAFIYKFVYNFFFFLSQSFYFIILFMCSRVDMKFAQNREVVGANMFQRFQLLYNNIRAVEQQVQRHAEKPVFSMKCRQNSASYTRVNKFARLAEQDGSIRPGYSIKIADDQRGDLGSPYFFCYAQQIAVTFF